jgi:hypothetical protein
MTTDPQPQAPAQPILRQKFDNVSLLFLIITLLVIMVFSSKFTLTDEVRSWLMQITTTVVGAYIGLTQGGTRQPWTGQPSNSAAAVAIKPGETAPVNNTTPPATTNVISGQ